MMGIGLSLCRRRMGGSGSILGLSGMAYWVAGTETDSQNLTQLGSSGAGDAQFGSTSGSDSNDPSSLSWYATTDYDVTVDGVNYKYLSDNLVTNGTFDTDTDWTKSSTTIGSGVATWTASSGYIEQDIPISAGKTYLIETEVTSVTAGSVVPRFTGGSPVVGSGIGTVGTNRQLLIAVADTNLRYVGSTSTISIDNIVVREVTANLGDSVWLPGSTSNFLSHPDSAAVSVTGDITIQVECALDDWIDGGPQYLLSKWENTGNNRSYILFLNATGNVGLYYSPDGSSAPSYTSTAVISITDGSKAYIRVSVDVDNGASDAAIKFYTSIDGESFTQLGSTVNPGATISAYDSTAPVEIGSIVGGTIANAAGSFYSAHIWNSDIGSTATSSAPTPVMHWEASSMTQSGGADEESGGTWTINRSASGLKSTLVTRPVIVFNSAASTYLEAADHDDLDIDGEGTWWLYMRYNGIPNSGNDYFIDKRSGASTGYGLWDNTSGGSDDAQAFVGDGSLVTTAATTPTFTDSTALLVSGIKSATGISYAIGNTISAETATTADGSSTATLKIGVRYNIADPSDLELFAAGVLKGTALTATQLASLKTELDTLLGGRTGE